MSSWLLGARSGGSGEQRAIALPAVTEVPAVAVAPRARLRGVPDALALGGQDPHEHGHPALLLGSGAGGLAQLVELTAAPQLDRRQPARRTGGGGAAPHLGLGVPARDEARKLLVAGMRVQAQRGGHAGHVARAQRLAERGRRRHDPAAAVERDRDQRIELRLRELKAQPIDGGLGDREVAGQELEAPRMRDLAHRRGAGSGVAVADRPDAASGVGIRLVPESLVGGDEFDPAVGGPHPAAPLSLTGGGGEANSSSSSGSWSSGTASTASSSSVSTFRSLSVACGLWTRGRGALIPR